MKKLCLVMQCKEQGNLLHQNYGLIHITGLKDVGTPHVMDDSLRCKHSVQQNENLLDLVVYIIPSTYLLTFKNLGTLLNYPPLYLILIILFHYLIEKLTLFFSGSIIISCTRCRHLIKDIMFTN